MQKRTKSALLAFFVLAVAFVSVFLFDYTDKYVADRFVSAVREERIAVGDSFPLDRLMEYYDWDTVCVVLPGSEHHFRTIFGLPYEHGAHDENSWSLVLIKEDAVNAEIRLTRDFLQPPDTTQDACFDRWHAVFSLQETPEGGLQLIYEGS